jgi:hypothetical protein
MGQEALGVLAPVQGRDANESTAVSREIASIQGAIFMARKFPRDEQASKNRILAACKRPGLAFSAIYKYARGGANVEGPSIRLAETLAQAWGNIDYGIRELEQGDGESVVEAYAWDLETNTRQTKRFVVPHKRHTRNGDTALDDPRDIYEMVANNGARRLRACILGVIPSDIAEMAVEACKFTQTSNVQVNKESIDKLLVAFAEYGVTKEMIEARVMRNIDAIDAYLMNELRNIYTSLRDGIGKPSDYFDMSITPKQHGFSVNQKKQSPLKEQAPTKPEAKEPQDEKQQEVDGGDDIADMFAQGNGQQF